MDQILISILVFILITLIFQIEKNLAMWNDQDFGGIATQRDLISRLSKNSQTSFCKPLIEALKANCPSK